MSRHFRPLNSARVKHKIQELTKPKEGETYVINRNPRNLEKLRIAYKPSGYHLENPGRSFWHKLEVNISSRYITADVKHYQNGPILSASTSEWAIKKQLFKTNDTAAYVNLGRVLAARCLQSGITEMMCNIEAVKGGKLDKFLETLTQNGVSLTEPERIKADRPWDMHRQEKPWEVLEEHLTQMEQQQKSITK